MLLLAIPLMLLLAFPARKLALMPRRVFRAVVLYYTIAYVAHGLYLLLVNPTPGPHSLVADNRLLRPGYLDGLGDLAPAAALGLAVLLLVSYAGIRALAPPRSDSSVKLNQSWAAAAVIGLALGWIARMYSIGTHSADTLSGLQGRLGLLATVALGILIVCTDWRSSSYLRAVVALAFAGQGVWAVASHSKTPLLGVALFLYLDPSRRRINAASVLTIVGSLLIAFAVIQPGKVTLAPGDYNGSPFLGTPAQIIGRIDLVHPLTSANVAGPGSFMTGSEFVSQLVQAWTPQSLTGATKVTAAVLWNQRLNGATDPTHVSDGPTAEGYAIWGTFGTVVSNIALGIAVALVGSSLASRRSFGLSAIALGVIAQNALFETGPLQFNEDLSNAVQVALLALLIYAVTRQARVHPGVAVARASSSSTTSTPRLARYARAEGDYTTRQRQIVRSSTERQ